MMLSPADYAAYSRQTGRAYPQSEEEKAEMYGEVRNFRENQLKGPSALETAGGIALGAGALAGIGAAAMKLRGRGKDPRMVSGLSKGKSGVQKADLSDMAAVRRVAEVDPQSVPTKTVTRTEVYKNVAAKPESELPQVSRPQGAVEESMLVTDPNTGEVYRRGGGRPIRAEELRDQTVVKVTEEKPTTLVDIQESREPLVVEQNIEALDTASDQAAAPIERSLQRNEDVDVGLAQAFLNNKRDQLESKGLSPTRIERSLAADRATAEAAELYASTGDPAVLQRFSDTPASPMKVEPRSALPGTDSPVGRQKASDMPEGGVETGKLFRKAPFGEFKADLEEKDIDLTNRISELGVEQQNLESFVAGRRAQLEQDDLMLRSAMDREPPDQDSYSKMLATVNSELQNLPDPKASDIKADINDAAAERELVRRQIKAADELGPQQFLIDQSEGSRAFYETTPEGVVIEETLEIRPGRKAIDVVGGKGGGRSVAEFTAGLREPDLRQRTVFVPVNESAQKSKRSGAAFGPWPKGSLPATSSVTVKTRRSDDIGNQLTDFEGDRTQTGGRMGLYGPERTGERATPGQRPTQPTMDETISQALADSVADELGIPTPPDQDLVFTRTSRQQSQDPLKASEAIRRARIEGDRRDPQSILRAMGFGV